LAASGGIFEADVNEQRIAELEKNTSVPGFWDNTSEAQSVIKRLNVLKAISSRFNDSRRKIEDLKTLNELAQESVKENAEDAQLECEITEGIDGAEKELLAFEVELKLSGPNDSLNAIMSIHAGAGGTEACDWADMLLRMYMRWAENKRFKTEMVDVLPGDEAGIKSVTLIINGRNAYGLLKSEIGVHRLVRISPFDSNKRRHTSFASCDVIPEIEDDIEIKINESDIRIDTYRASGHGGQHLQKTDSAVRITHIPTGIVVSCQAERSQFKNKMMAMKVLRARLYEFEMEEKRSRLDKHYSEKGDIAWGNQIRSYVFMPYQLVKDHRTDTETGNVQKVMDGDIDLFIEAYLQKFGSKIDFASQ
jgi:peptide chain release factor 2